MSLITVIFIILAAIFAFGLSFLQYLYKVKQKRGKPLILFVLRFFSLFLLLLLVINPKITSTQYKTKKPELALAIDNSVSISHLDQANSVKNFIERVTGHPGVRERFNIQEFTFGRNLHTLNELDFKEDQTNISSALYSLRKLYKTEKTAMIMLTDGNQTYGRDYQYYSSGPDHNLLSVVVGDTTTYNDLSIENINVNKYAFLNNMFPVEVIMNYQGQDTVKTVLEITSEENIVFSENVEFSGEKSSEVLETSLPVTGIGVQTYEVKVRPLESEKNKLNNSRKFAIEIIDEKTSILLLTEISHPDLGALKKSVETNEQRKVEIKNINDDFEIIDFDLVILYQPNERFNTAFRQIENYSLNHFIITGTNTSWNFLNNIQALFQKEVSLQDQEIFPVVNLNFSRFQFEDIGFEDFPPLIDSFGDIEFNSDNYSVLLYQNIEGIESEQALLAISEESSRKSGILFGENIWRWRSQAFVDSGSFEEFDNFIGKLMQNLTSTKELERLTVAYEPFFYGNEEVQISAQYFDENFEFYPSANLLIDLQNTETGEKTEASLLLKDNRYVVDFSGLEASAYDFNIVVKETGITKSGSFTIVDANVEEQFVSANLSKLKQLSSNNQQTLYFISNPDLLIQDLLKDENYQPIQTARKKTLPLVEWYYLLGLLVLLLSIEWFYRKYTGLI